MHLSDDQLALLALGDQQLGDEIRVHLDTCPECLRAYGGLWTVVRLGRQSEELRNLPKPPARVWDAIARDIDIDTEPVRRRPSQVGRRAMLVAAAALVAILATFGIGSAVRHPDRPQVVSTTVLGALPAAPAQAHGTAQVVRISGGTQLRITLSDMPTPPGYYEAWLFDPNTGAMYPMGPLTTSGGTLTISGVDLDRYIGVDISAQPIDDTGGHGQSMLRGTLR